MFGFGAEFSPNVTLSFDSQSLTSAEIGSMSFVPPHITPPDSPIAKAVLLAFSIFMSLVMIVFVGIVSIDFLSEMAGQPFFGAQSPPLDLEFLPEQDTLTEFKSPFELISPKHQTRMRCSDIVVIYTRRFPDASTMPPDLIIDTIRYPWEWQYGNNTWFARFSLPVGLHHVQVEEAEAEFFVEASDAPFLSPESWTWNFSHPGTDQMERCHDCHVLIDVPSGPLTLGQGKAIGIWKGIASCFDCHDVVEHEYRHVAVQPADKCLRCHAMH